LILVNAPSAVLWLLGTPLVLLSRRRMSMAMMTHAELMPPKPVVLVIEDDSAVRNSLKFALEAEGFCVRVYPTGSDFLKEPDMPENGCIVTDYNLPGMNGLDILARLRERKVSLPAILITTHPSVAVRNRAALADVRLIEKPLLSDALVQGIRAALGETAQPH
jgi:two-component system, LuxR family, response regulator FixJ